MNCRVVSFSFKISRSRPKTFESSRRSPTQRQFEFRRSSIEATKIEVTCIVIVVVAKTQKEASLELTLNLSFVRFLHSHICSLSDCSHVKRKILFHLESILFVLIASYFRQRFRFQLAHFGNVVLILTMLGIKLI